MFYLKGVRCKCGGKFLIQKFHDKKKGKYYVDGAICQGCLKNEILPDEEYRTFVGENGET